MTMVGGPWYPSAPMPSPMGHLFQSGHLSCSLPGIGLPKSQSQSKYNNQEPSPAGFVSFLKPGELWLGSISLTHGTQVTSNLGAA